MVSKIKFDANEKDHWDFIKSIQQLDDIFGWKVVSMSCGAYVWLNEKNKNVTIYITPYFEKYKRICITICPYGEMPVTMDPIPLHNDELTTQDFHDIVKRKINKIRFCERLAVAKYFFNENESRFNVNNSLRSVCDVLIGDEESVRSQYSYKTNLSISKIIELGYTFEKQNEK